MPLPHSEAKVVDARVLGPGHHASSSSRGSGHSKRGLVGPPKGGYLQAFSKTVPQSDLAVFDQL